MRELAAGDPHFPDDEDPDERRRKKREAVTKGFEDLAARHAHDKAATEGLILFVARCYDLCEKHWVIAKDRESAERILDSWRWENGRRDLWKGRDYEPDWQWATLGPDDSLSEVELEPVGERTIPVRDWIREHGSGHLSWAELG